MNILLLGSGGREHAIAWKIRQSPRCSRLLIAPGNGGTSACGENKPFSATDFESVRRCCIEEKIDLLIVGPEEPLVRGIVDFLRKEEKLKDLMIIGPTGEAAQLEGSKAYAKAFMQRHHIPTAGYREFTEENFTEGLEYLKAHQLPIVLKADGLAAGKGVIICQHHVEAVAEFELMIQRAKFGEAGRRVVVEQFLSGIELSVFVLTDGKNYVVLPEAKDYKRVGEGDTGPNTGGMGAISPVPFADKVFMEKVRTKVIEPTVTGLAKDGLDYKGFIFIGLIKVDNEPYVIEYNCRMGDPETEAVMPRLKNDLAELLSATARGELDKITIEQDPRFAATIVAVSGGYPDSYQKGLPIEGIDKPYFGEDTLIFHAGTKKEEGQLVTSGGRVFCATSLAASLEDALEASREAIQSIRFEQKYYRPDIGYEFTRKG